MNAQATTTIPVGSYVRTADGQHGYFIAVSGPTFVLNIGGERKSVLAMDANVTHVPGFMAEDDNGEIRYYLLESNARDWNRAETVVAALVPIGARLHDVFDSIADYDADNPALAAVERLELWSARRQEKLIFASEDAAFSYSRDNRDCLTDDATVEVACHHPWH